MKNKKMFFYDSISAVDYSLCHFADFIDSLVFVY